MTTKDEDGPAAKGAPRWPYVVLALALLVLGGGIWTAYDRGLFLSDSGVEACEAMRGGSTTFRTDPDEGEPLTEADYHRAREIFAGSRHDDIREHGTRMMDIVWRMSQVDDTEALLYVQPLTTQALGLESACADQGVFLPFKEKTPKKALTLVACAKVFRSGQPIAQGFDGACGNTGGGMQLVPALDCKDGRRLYRVAATTGAQGGWGYAGALYKAVGDATTDPAYSNAVRKCLG